MKGRNNLPPIIERARGVDDKWIEDGCLPPDIAEKEYEYLEKELDQIKRERDEGTLSRDDAEQIRSKEERIASDTKIDGRRRDLARRVLKALEGYKI